jgi:acetolactate synthase-1/2/3 large subunit
MYSTAIITREMKKYSNNLYIYPGGTIAPLLHEAKRDGLNLIVTKHEQGAGYMALAEASLYNRSAFVAVTSGPGATNIITVIADAYYDSIPLIVITGQVGTADLSRSSELRQRGFQEVPIVNMVKEVTKRTYQPKTLEELHLAIINGIFISNHGRKGPVLIDLPMNLQLQEITQEQLENFSFDTNIEKENNTVTDFNFNEIIKIINAAKKPLVLVGGGAQNDWKIVRNFLQKTSIPVVSSLRGLGIMNQENNIGWIGHTGLPWANSAFFEADTIIVLGSRLDVRQTGTKVETLQDKKIIHVDIDDIELLHCRIDQTIKLNINIKDFITAIDNQVDIKNTGNWLAQIKDFKKNMRLDDSVNSSDTLMTPKNILQHINSKIECTKTNITTGVGSHQHWVARYIDFDNERCKLFTSAGHGTMGYGLPTAIGLSKLLPEYLTICFDGDGSFQLNIQELALIKEFNLKTKILIFDNSRLGIVSQFQNITFQDDPTTGHKINPDFVEIGKAYGIKSLYLDTFNTNILDEWLFSDEACLLHVKIMHDTPLSPMLLGGQNMNEMWYANAQ